MENGSGPSQSHRDRGTKMTDEEQGCHGENVGALGALQRMPARAPLRGNNIILSRKAAKDAKKPTPGTLPHRPDGIGQTETSRQPRTPPMKWINYPNLLRRPHAPNAGRGRLQVQIRRAFAVREVLTSSEIYDSCYAKRRVAGQQIDRPYRWSVLRILRTIAEPIGRASTIGCPWLWRLKQDLAS